MAISSTTSATLPADALANVGVTAAREQNAVQKTNPSQNAQPDTTQNPSTLVTLSAEAKKLSQEAQANQLQASQDQEQSSAADALAAVGNAANAGSGTQTAQGSPGIQFVQGESKGGHINTYA